MSRKIFYLLIGLLFLQVSSLSQEWVQTAGTPMGGGVTDMLVKENGDIFVTTSSYNWPSVQGGIRRSTNDGDTWQNIVFAYNSRTIEEAPNGTLYASIWWYPNNEGLFYSTDNGTTWYGPLVDVPSGDNIFSIAIDTGTSQYSMFVGTRNGIFRSTNSGSSFQYANNGIPSNSWVYDLAIDSTSGIVAAATTNGLFVSTNNGDLWLQTTGLPTSDTTVSLLFDYPLPIDNSTLENGSYPRLIIGTHEGNLFQSSKENSYAWVTALYVFAPSEEVVKIAEWTLLNLNTKYYGVCLFPNATNGGGVYTSTNLEQGFTAQNDGLPSNPKTSAFGIAGVRGADDPDRTETIQVYVGLYEDSSNGAKIYKRTYTVDVEQSSSGILGEYDLAQNYPNPFNPTTTIKFAIPNESFVRLEIFNTLGEKVTTLVSEELNAGHYKYEWDAKGLPSGIYFYRLQTQLYAESKKMILIK